MDTNCITGCNVVDMSFFEFSIQKELAEEIKLSVVIAFQQ